MSNDHRSHDDRLLDALGELEGIVFSGPVWRVVREGRPVFDGSKGSGRWNPNHLSVLYTAKDPEGALAEIYFHLSRGQSVFPSRIQHRLFELRIQTSNSLSLVDTKLLGNLGVDGTTYKEMLYHRTQEIADAASFMGFDSIVAPSARHPSHVLIVLLPNFQIENLEVISDQEVDWQSWRKKIRLAE